MDLDNFLSVFEEKSLIQIESVSKLVSNLPLIQLLISVCKQWNGWVN